MNNRPVLFALVAALGLTLATPRAARADFVDPYARIELGVAFPLSAPQTDYFNPGFGGRLNLGLGLGQWFGLQLTAQMLALPARAAAPSSDPSVPIGLGGGFRLKLPYTYKAAPWIDADLFYVRTGKLDRVGWDVGAGVHFPLGARKIIRLGPFVRLFSVVDNSEFQFDTRSSYSLIVGLSVEAGFAQTAASDKDKDGVADGDDRCPDEAGPARTAGCPDADGDGLLGDADRCPDAAGPASAKGCPDKDGDGVVDSDDACPEQAGSAKAGGCPDKDADGIADARDLCPDQPGATATSGCPDQDADGVADAKDECPSQAGPAAGCPDQDKDGVADAKDECPAAAGATATRGCPDQDSDGVADAADLCPGEAGEVAHKGCPAPKATVSAGKIDINQKVYFVTGGTAVSERSFALLDEVAKVLGENPRIKLRVEGHTDNQGRIGRNRYLSKMRAKAVVDYLVAHGVKASRLASQGFGPDRPIADNGTDAGREQNRRVDLLITGNGGKAGKAGAAVKGAAPRPGKAKAGKAGRRLKHR